MLPTSSARVHTRVFTSTMAETLSFVKDEPGRASSPARDPWYLPSARATENRNESEEKERERERERRGRGVARQIGTNWFSTATSIKVTEENRGINERRNIETRIQPYRLAFRVNWIFVRNIMTPLIIAARYRYAQFRSRCRTSSPRNPINCFFPPPVYFSNSFQ